MTEQAKVAYLQEKMEKAQTRENHSLVYTVLRIILGVLQHSPHLRTTSEYVSSAFEKLVKILYLKKCILEYHRTRPT